MTEIILGVGQQKSLRNVLYAAEMELHRTHGPPRKVQLRGGGIELAAARPQFDGAFVAFVARLMIQIPFTTVENEGPRSTPSGASSTHQRRRWIQTFVRASVAPPQAGREVMSDACVNTLPGRKLWPAHVPATRSVHAPIDGWVHGECVT